MGHVYPLHPCALPGCDKLHKNAKYCCRDHERQAQALVLTTQMRRYSRCGRDHPVGEYVVVAGDGRRTYSKWCPSCRADVPAELRGAAGQAQMFARARDEKAAQVLPAKRPEQVPAASPGVGLLWVEGLRLGHPSWPVGPNSIQGAPFGA